MKKILTLILILELVHFRIMAQSTSPADSTDTAPWDVGVEASFYFVEKDIYVLPVLTADYHHLHLESRYNYEDFQTLSLFAGYNIETEGKISLLLTPMLGIAFGNTSGIIPGLEATVSWSALELYTETEWLIDPGDAANNFIYTWSDLTYAPLDHFYFGLSGQRTRTIDTGFEIERGIVAGYYNDWLTISAYTYNIGTEDFFFLFNTAVSF
jgi:hypothetical protein